MDRRRRPRQHSLELAARPAAAGPSHDGGTMSSELYLAVCGGRMEEAMALLLRHHASGSGIDQLVSAGRNTVLHLAAVRGHDELIQELYATYGGRSNLLSSQNWTLDTPLHCAARAGQSNTVSLLVQLARDQDQARSILGSRNEAGDTALHLAARLGHGAAVEAMVAAAPDLASEANVNAAGASPLFLAVMGGSVPAVRAIAALCGCGDALDAGAGLRSRNALHAPAVFHGSGHHGEQWSGLDIGVAKRAEKTSGSLAVN
ncbi:ankyrin-1 isoform X2 [Brachypodium distachyon]|uniref:Uncharacterized protein n=1 Tax=Brachypodium distachyon TaxID=15368 RepID=A0A2K2CPT2_BRADI|nr:ankyrin-1 isoform X2 [Brachypodium distachyon]PNT64031.1 hypothetical protein BRADI_4g23687v3 [Brachypodium distachyon]|eukprot:XP_024310792.1 ankyrin-1 isoform X2 [Brachypodium distachyon]